MNKNRWKVITGILLILILGAFSGALGTGFYMKNRIQRFIDPKGPPPPVRILHRQLDRLDLSPEQRTKIDAKLRQMEAGFNAIILKAKPELDAHFKHHMPLLRAELSPEQQRVFDKAIARIEDRIKRMERPPFAPPPATTLPQLQAEFGLTSEQARKSAPVIVSMEKKKRAILHRFEKAGELLREKMDVEMEQLMDRTEGELADFLSAEQANRVRKVYAPKGMGRWPSPSRPRRPHDDGPPDPEAD